MDRRKYLATFGMLAAGSAGAIGTGAFTSVQAERSVSVSVAGDSDALLGLEPTNHPNSDYVHTTNGQVEIALDESDSGGNGFNKNAVTEINEMLKVTNQGTQTIYFWVEHPNSAPFTVDNFWFHTSDSPSTKLHNGDAGDGNDHEVLTLSPGESAKLGVKADFGDVSPDASFSGEVTFYANSTKPDGSGPVDSGGDDALVVSQNPNPENDNEFGSIQDAVDAAQGTTILVESGTYDESVSIDKPGLTIEGLGSNSTTIDASGEERGLHIKADGVTIRDLTIDSAGSNVESGEVEGIFVGNADGFSDDGVKISIENVNITNIDGTGSGKTTEGIHIKHYDGGDPINGVDIKNVTIDGVDAPGGMWVNGGRGANGIKLQSDITNINITNTKIKDIAGGWSYGVTATASSNESGIPKNVSFDSVTIDNVVASGSDYSSIGVGIDSASGDPISPENGKVADPEELSFADTNIANVDIGLANKNTGKELSAPEGVSFDSSVSTTVVNLYGE